MNNLLVKKERNRQVRGTRLGKYRKQTVYFKVLRRKEKDKRSLMQVASNLTHQLSDILIRPSSLYQ